MHADSYAGLRDLRAFRPDAVAEAAARRQRRPALLGPSGTLMMVAADHPGRGAFGVRDDADAMADRYDLLDRLVTALGRPGVDGVLAGPDILEDLLLLGALEDKIVVGSMNRGGIQGAVFELDDRFTAYTADRLAAYGFDGGKMLCRVDPMDAATAPTLQACSRAVSDLADRRLMAMVEPFWCGRKDGRVHNDLTAAGVIRSAAIASALGSTSAHTWLKLPVVPDMEKVMRATTLPTLLLGGDPSDRPEDTYATWQQAVALPGVRGLVIGRALLYPPGGNVGAAVDAAVALLR